MRDLFVQRSSVWKLIFLCGIFSLICVGRGRIAESQSTAVPAPVLTSTSSESVGGQGADGGASVPSPSKDSSVDVVPNPPQNQEAVADQNAPETKILKSIEAEIKKKKGADIYVRSSVPSLVFTPSQYALLREARIGFNTRAPTLAELRSAGDPNDPNYRPPVAVRNLSLGGIVYNSPDDWTVWLNNSRVTPDAIPADAIDIRVYRDYVEIKWFDQVTNQIFPVRLRSNQRFNLDTRVFLPG